MKTQKEILQWCKDLNKRIKGIDDWENLRGKLDKSLSTQEIREGNVLMVKIKSPAWKYCMFLNFYDIETPKVEF
uniref:Uncharacterized protein n=1 Tax=Caldisericum exile TaxID=693075 RepID=A0A7C4XT84_9BACT